MAETNSNLELEEFSTNFGNSTVYYQILWLEGSVYVWVGTESGQMSGLAAVYASRIATTGPSVAYLLGPSESFSGQLGARLQKKIRKNVLLSINVEEEGLHAHIEDILADRLSRPM